MFRHSMKKKGCVLAALRRFRLLILLTTLILSVVPPDASAIPSAQAQAAPRLATLAIDVWPEYDRLGTVLVIYRGELAASGAPTPGQVKLRIPASAGEPSALASPEPGKETTLVNQWTDLFAAKKASASQSGDWIEVTFSPLSRLFTLEFYDKLNTVTFDRRYTLTWPGDMAADAITLNVREPFGASSFQATPALSPGARDDEGLVAHLLTVGALNAGQTLPITLTYRREDQRTSVEALQLATPAPTRQLVSIPAASTTSQWPLVVALGVGLALIFGGVVWYLRSRSKQAYRPYAPPRYTHPKGRRSVRTASAPRARPQPVAMRLVEDEPEEKIYCTQCGKPLNADDTFCSRCGTRVKGK